MAQLSDVNERGSRLRERCNSEGRVTIDGKLQTLQRRWSDVKEKISSKVQVVEGEIGEWSDFTKEVDQRLTELRNVDISLGAAIISTAELKVLEEQLAKVKVCFGRDVRSKLEFELHRGCCKSSNTTLSVSVQQFVKQIIVSVFHLQKNSRKFRMGCKWNTTFWFVPLETSRNKRNS